MSERVRVVRRQGDVEEIRYRKADDRRFYKHATEGPTDLFLVEIDGKRGSLAMPRGDVDGWEEIDGDYWLTNKPRRSRRSRGVTMAAKRSKRTSSRRTARRGTARQAPRRKKRRPPAGYASWSAYMASIRPPRRRARATGSPTSASGGTMASKRKRRRRSTARRHHASNPPAAKRRRSTRRRTYRRNPFGGRGLVGQVTNLAKEGVIGGVTVVAGEAATRLVRGRVLGMAAGQTLSSVAEAGIAVAGGLVVERMFGRQAGRDFVVGGVAGILRATAKQLGVPFVADALADDGGRIILPRNRAVAGYVRGPGLGSYVDTDNSALGDEYAEEIDGGY